MTAPQPGDNGKHQRHPRPPAVHRSPMRDGARVAAMALLGFLALLPFTSRDGTAGTAGTADAIVHSVTVLSAAMAGTLLWAPTVWRLTSTRTRADLARTSSWPTIMGMIFMLAAVGGSVLLLIDAIAAGGR